jgi:NAD+ synthase
MATLYYVAQAVGGIVVNTSNLSESILGYGTLYGDIAGSFAPLRGLTATEVVQIGHELGLPAHLVDKTPADGLSGKTDEDNLGVKYADVDKYIRYGASVVDEQVVKIVNEKYKWNKFKSDIIDIPGVLFEDYPNYVVNPQ